jgi:hypothetical protein
MVSKSTSGQRNKLRREIRKTSNKARLSGLGLILCGAFLMAMGLWSNTSSQRQFTESVNSTPTILDPVVNNVAPLKLGRKLETPLMNLMPFVMMGIGVLSIGGGIRSVITGISDKEKNKLFEKFNFYFKCHWPESRGDNYDSWGGSWWYLHTDGSGKVLRQMEKYDSGVIIRYDQSCSKDEYGELSNTPVEWKNVAESEITKEEFEEAWNLGESLNRKGTIL